MKKIFKSKKNLIGIISASIIFLLIFFALFSNKNNIERTKGAISDINTNDRTYKVGLDSNEMEINKEKGYIYTNGLLKEKDILNYINALNFDMGVIMYNLIYNNKLKSFVGLESIADYDLIRITSPKYKIEDKNIYYYGEFDISKIRITNAQGMVSNGKLIVKYDNQDVAEYNLINQGGLLGDVNNDGEVTISDMIPQYKYFEYIIELDERAYNSADINLDEDIEQNDINSLYEMIKVGK